MSIPRIEGQVRRNIGAEAEAREFGRVHWAAKADDPPGAEMTAALAVFDAGKGNVEHTHPNAEEIVYVLAGEMRHTLGPEETLLRAGDLIVVPRGAPHRLFNVSEEPVRAFIVFSSPDRQFVPVE